MTERSRPWDGTTTGDATEAPYDAATEWAKIRASMVGADQIANYGGVYADVLNELAVSGSATPAVVATGRADVYGTWYDNDAAFNVAIPTPAAADRIDRIVLRKSWASQTVRITRIAGVEGGGAPALVQNAGLTWDIPLAQILVEAVSGTFISVTDQRDFLLSGSGVWIDFTPAMNQGATPLTIAIDYARYIADGKTAHLQLALDITSAGAPSDTFELTAIPAAIQPKQVGSTTRVVGTFVYIDTSTGIRYVGSVYAFSATVLHFQVNAATADFAVSPAITAANGDFVGIVATWEIA